MIGGDGFSDIVGKTIDAVYLDAGRAELLFAASDGVHYVYGAQGDCCARAYFEAPEDASFDQIIGHEITAADRRDGGAFDGDDDANDVYFYSIKTARGVADVELRVSHNGYYGGEAYLVSAEFAKDIGPAWKLLAGTPRCVVHDDCRADRGLGVACAQAVRP